MRRIAVARYWSAADFLSSTPNSLNVLVQMRLPQTVDLLFASFQVFLTQNLSDADNPSGADLCGSGKLPVFAREAGIVFRTPKRTLGDLDADIAAKLIAAAADIALVVDAKGIIRDIAFGNDELAKEGYDKWVGQPWIDTVTIESRPKIQELLDDSASKARRYAGVRSTIPRKRGDIPIRYSSSRSDQARAWSPSAET